MINLVEYLKYIFFRYGLKGVLRVWGFDGIVWNFTIEFTWNLLLIAKFNLSLSKTFHYLVFFWFGVSTRKGLVKTT